MLRGRDALPDGPEAPVGVLREGVQGHVRGKRPSGRPPSPDQVPGRGEDEPGVREAAQVA